MDIDDYRKYQNYMRTHYDSDESTLNGRSSKSFIK